MPGSESSEGWARTTKVVAVLALMARLATQAHADNKLTRSPLKRGPDSLVGWTLESAVPDSGYGDERFAFTLVITHHGHIIRRIRGAPIIWKWIFWENGREVAYDTGPFHFAETCKLVSLSDGRELDSYDCYHEQPPIKPDWVKALDAEK